LTMGGLSREKKPKPKKTVPLFNFQLFFERAGNRFKEAFDIVIRRRV